jgi:hypothetical protein
MIKIIPFDSTIHRKRRTQYEKKICCYTIGSFSGFSVSLNLDSCPCSGQGDEAQAFRDVAAPTPLDQDV